MPRHVAGAVVLLMLFFASAVSCRRSVDPSAPPDARRPVLKHEAELAADRSDRIARGEVVANPTPVVEAEREQLERLRRPPPPAAPPGSIRADLLLIDDAVLTVDEVLYPLRDAIDEARRTRTARGFVEQVERLVRDQVRGEIGRQLIYAKALSGLSDPQKEQLDKSVQHDIEARVTSEFGGSEARLRAHLEEHGLTLEKYREAVKRELVVRTYTREMLLPQVQVRREELLRHYRENLPQYSTPEARELLLIELPFAAFAPQGAAWESLSETARAPAKLEAMRRARAAHGALRARPFDEVAREFSRGRHAEAGGAWGLIAQPLQPPYDEVSRRIFSMQPGAVSEPIETPDGWYIVGCGGIEAGSVRSFEQVQEEIRKELEERRFNRIANEYVLKLAAKATIVSLDAFIRTAVERVAAGDWPRGGDRPHPPAPAGASP